MMNWLIAILAVSAVWGTVGIIALWGKFCIYSYDSPWGEILYFAPFFIGMVIAAYYILGKIEAETDEN